MLISYRWLGRHVDLEGLEPEALAEELTLSTAEVEGVTSFAPHLSRVTVGHVLERKSHPDAEKLSVCTVDVGAGDPLQIVCGADNVDAGQNVAVATVGTLLPGEFKIKKSRIRGVDSRGMICSEDELELGHDHSGIWVLPEGLEAGRPVLAALGLEDWVLEIDNKSITHRPDLWGHRGIAGEVAAITGRELLPLDLSLPELGPKPAFPLRVESADCPRYMGLAIDGVQPLRSPDWLRFLLLAAGQRPIDQIVDLSNFVMLDLGQPNHTFDRTRLSAQGIVVRNARENESITTLDGEARALIPADLLICSGDDPVALAGVMGGEGSMVEEATSELLLEVACFLPAPVRRTAKRLGLRTDASTRFEKHLDPTLPQKALAHFARLLTELQPAVRFPCQLSDAGEWQDPAHTLELRPARLRTALGAEIADSEIVDILQRLGFGVRKASTGDTGGTGADVLEVDVPSARATKDITIEQDLIEEVGRIHRYGNVPEALMTSAVVPPPVDPRRRLVRRLQDRLAGGERFHELISYSFEEDALLANLGLADESYVEVINPVAEGQAKVRRAVLPSLLGRLTSNRRQRDEVRLFEIGNGYRPEDEDERGQPGEVHELALAWAAPPPAKNARFDHNTFSRLQGVLVDLFQAAGVCAPTWSAVEAPPSWAHPTRCLAAHLTGVDERVALLASLEPGVARALGLEGELQSDVAVAEVSLDLLLVAPERPPGYSPILRFPGIKLDVAVSAPDEMSAGVLVEVIQKAGKGALQSLELFDLYRGASLGVGQKSLAWHVLLQSDKKTLTDKDEAKFLGRLERLLEPMGAQLRRG